jgi:hypothetical protein
MTNKFKIPEGYFVEIENRYINSGQCYEIGNANDLNYADQIIDKYADRLHPREIWLIYKPMNSFLFDIKEVQRSELVYESDGKTETKYLKLALEKEASSQCRCGGKAQELHKSHYPFYLKVGDESMCNCCEDCEYDSVMDSL